MDHDIRDANLQLPMLRAILARTKDLVERGLVEKMITILERWEAEAGEGR